MTGRDKLEQLGRRMSRKEAAEYLGACEQTLADWAVTGRVKLPFSKVGGKCWYWEADLIELLLAGRRGGDVPAARAS